MEVTKVRFVFCPGFFAATRPPVKGDFVPVHTIQKDILPPIGAA